MPKSAADEGQRRNGSERRGTQGVSYAFRSYRWLTALELSPLRVKREPLAEVADGEGFEPPLPCGKHAFQACAFDHSATHPELTLHRFRAADGQ
jgi:hypothetical protein